VRIQRTCARTRTLCAEVDPPTPPWPIPTDTRAVHRRRSSGSGRSARRRRRRRPSSRPRRTRKTNPPSPTEASSPRPRRRSRPVLSPAPPRGPAPRGRARGISSRRSRRDDPPRGPRRADAGRRRSQRRNLPRKTSQAKHSSPAVGGTSEKTRRRILLTTTRSGRKTRDRARRHGARARCACPTNGASSTREAASGDQGQHPLIRRRCLHRQPRLLGSTTPRRLGHTTNRGRPRVMPPSTSNHPKPHRPRRSPSRRAAASRTRRGINQ